MTELREHVERKRCACRTLIKYQVFKVRQVCELSGCRFV
jgi:hypothetical protein